MKKIFEKIITGFFVFILGILWYFSVKHYVKPNQYNLIVYDVLGRKCELEGIRADFRTKEVAISYTKEYQSRFPQYNFSIEESIPEIKSRVTFPRILRHHR